MDKSYGINVARLAGLPEQVLLRADELLAHLEDKKIDPEELKTRLQTPIQVTDDKNKEVIDALKKIDPLTMSPLESMNFLYELKKKVK
jgi:DNA mismatch repair protein MutS